MLRLASIGLTTNQIVLTHHSRPTGTLTAIGPGSGDIIATVAPHKSWQIPW